MNTPQFLNPNSGNSAGTPTEKLSLSEVVSTLGRLLGEVLREQGGEELFGLVERTRALVRAARGGDAGAAGELSALISGLALPQAVALMRAFSWFFQLVNLAEEHERISRLAEREQRSESLQSAFAALRARGLGPDELRALLRVRLTPTFTAHPTEMRRRTVRLHLAAVARELPELHRPAVQRRVAARIEALWHTPELRRLKPTVDDEVKGGLAYLGNIAAALPLLEDDLRQAARASGLDPTGLELPLDFASWMGGDRDGNPFVTPGATRAALEQHRAQARALLLSLTDAAYADLSQADLQGGDPDTEPARDALRALHRDLAQGAVPTLRARVRDIERDLRTRGFGRSADALLSPLRTAAGVFGSALVALDIREHSGQVEAAVHALLAHEGHDYAGLNEAGRVTLLRRELQSRRPLLPAGSSLDGELESAIGPLRELRAAVLAVGEGAAGRYVVSMACAVSDVLEPLLLAREVGLDILPVPLFETLGDLEAAPRVVAELLELPEYRAVLGERVQEIMLGYSDSNKDAGFLAANWALHEAQRSLAAVCRAAGVRWRFFHGRGTSIGRGGGPAGRAILGQPPGTVGAGLRLTEQGEALADKYAHPLAAHRNLEQALHGLLLAAAATDTPLPGGWEAAMARAAAVSAHAYRELVQGDGFLAWFEGFTPIHEIAGLNIASRPVRRPGAPTLQNLRAIPWVMSWTQTRANLPGWYGLREGLRELGPLAAEMYREWPFFRSVLDGAQMSLAKADPLIVAEYARLSTHRELSDALLKSLADTVAAVEAVTGHPLLENEPTLRESIRLRNPYIDPIHRLQAELLRRARAAGEDDPGGELSVALSLSLKGIAAGVRNTG